MEVILTGPIGHLVPSHVVADARVALVLVPILRLPMVALLVVNSDPLSQLKPAITILALLVHWGSAIDRARKVVPNVREVEAFGPTDVLRASTDFALVWK